MNFYVYIYLNPIKETYNTFNSIEFHYEPFYVGKGKENRCYEHLSDTLTKIKYNRKLNRKEYIIKNIIDNGQKPIVLIIKENLKEDEAFELEKFYISLIGRKDKGEGTLCNLTDGGEGTTGIKNLIPHNKGIKCSDEIKKRISDSRKGISPWNKGLVNVISSDAKSKMSNAKKGKSSYRKDINKYNDEIFVFDLNNILIKIYSNILELIKEKEYSKFDKYSILRVALGKRKTYKKLIFKFKK